MDEPYNLRSERRSNPPPLITSGWQDIEPPRPAVINFSGPLRHPESGRGRSSTQRHISAHAPGAEDDEVMHPETPPTSRNISPPRSAIGKHRSVDLLNAAWNSSSSTISQLQGAQAQSEATLWDPTTYRKLAQPTSALTGDSPYPLEAQTGQLNVDDALLSSVTLNDGRVAERDRASGQWRWKAGSIRTESLHTMGDDAASTYPLRGRRYSTSSKFSSGTPLRQQSPPPPLPSEKKDGIGHVSAMSHSGSSPPIQPPPISIFQQSSLPHEIAFVVVVCLAQFLALGGLAQTVAPLPILGDNFGITDPGTLSWYTAAFSLTVGTFILPAGRIGDMLGHKRVYMLGWIWYGIWSLITGFSFKSSSVVFTLCRAFQGMGPAFLVPNAMALIGITFPIGKKRNIIFALFGSMGPTGFVMGSIFSSLLAQKAWWPWMFFIMSILCFFIAGFAFLIIPASTKKSSQTITGKFDFPGAIFGVAGLVLVNFAFNQAPLSGWQDLYIPILLVAGIAIFACFIFIELKIAEVPLIPLKSLSKEGAFALACIAAGWGSHGIWLYYFFLFTERLRGHSPLAAAAQLTPVAITGVCFALSTGFLVKRIKVATIMLTAMMGFLFGLVFLASAPINQTYWALTFLSVLVAPLGMNLSFPAGTVLLSNAMPREHQGVAASLISTMVNYSISTGLGVAGTIDRYVTAAHTTSGQMPSPAATLQGYRGAWYFGMGLDVLGICISGYFVYKTYNQK